MHVAQGHSEKQPAVRRATTSEANDELRRQELLLARLSTGLLE